MHVNEAFPYSVLACSNFDYFDPPLQSLAHLMDGLHALLPRAIDLELIYHVVLHRGQNFELHLL